jgi:hypothetical protein
MSSNLILHAGAHSATEVEVHTVPTPESTETWTPVPHGRLLATVQRAVESSGLRVIRKEFGLFNEGARMFSVWALQNGINASDYQLTIGIRNSHDKSFSAGLAVGSRVFVCDNLSFSGEVTIARKHTRWINRDLDRLVAEAVGRVGDLRRFQDLRIEAYKARRLSDAKVHDLVIRSVDADVMANSYIAKVLGEYREPQHEDFRPRNAWSLFNAYTEVFKGTNPLDLSARTTRLHGLLDMVAGVGEPSVN